MNSEGFRCIECPECNGEGFTMKRLPRVGGGLHEVTCERCIGHGWRPMTQDEIDDAGLSHQGIGETRMTVTRTIELHDINPRELAELFAEMDSKMQARFFAAIRPIATKWPGAGWCQQSSSIIRDMDEDAAFVIETLASHLPAETLARLAETANG